MKKNSRRVIATSVSCALIISGCATTDRNGRPLTAMERSINQCIGSVVAGALLGALVGAAAGGRNSTARGAVIGAGAGTLVCAVVMVMNNEEDKRRVRESEINAVQTGQPQNAVYVGKDGRQRVVHITSEEADVPTSAQMSAKAATDPEITGPCRKAHTQVTVQNAGTVTLDPDLICRTSTGDYVTVSTNIKA